MQLAWSGEAWTGMGMRTAWPLLRGWMSRKAKTRSLSKSLKEGMSPALLLGWIGEKYLVRISRPGVVYL